jgi:hypothetical protein
MTSVDQEIQDMIIKFDQNFPDGHDGRKHVMIIRNIIVLTHKLFNYWKPILGPDSFKQKKELLHLKNHMLILIDLLFKRPDKYPAVLILIYKSNIFPNDIKNYNDSVIKHHDEMSEEDKKRVDDLHQQLKYFAKIMEFAKENSDKVSIPSSIAHHFS